MGNGLPSTLGVAAVAAYGRVIPAMVTPFDATGAVDYDRAAALARRLVEAGADGVLVGGTTAESPVLEDEEKVRLVATVVEAVGARVFVWAGTGSNDTRHSLELTQRAEAAGAHGIMLVTPYYNKPPQEGLYQHFRTVAQATRLPVMLYNVPGRTSANIESATVARLAQLPNVVAIKEASGSMDQVSEIRRLTPREFLIYSGDDSLTLPILAVGGHGVVSVAAHVVAGHLRRLIEAFQAGQNDVALARHLELLPLLKALFVTTNPIPVKLALKLSGFDPGGYRLPLVPPSAAEAEAVRQAMAGLGLLQEAAVR